MKLFNPTEVEVSVIISGKTLNVRAGSTVEVSDKDGDAWKKIHEFLIIQAQEAKTAVEPEKEQTQEVTVLTEVEPVVEEKPKKIKKK